MKKLLLTALLASTTIAFCQDGTWDSTFNIGTGANAAVTGIKVLPDGKILIAGQFEQYKGVAVNSIARLYANGDLDTSFTSPATMQSIYRTLFEADGKIVYATMFPGSQLNRVNADGTPDTTFTPPSFSFDGEIISISKQGEKYIVSGSFVINNPGGQIRGIVRLNADGTIDETFAFLNLYGPNQAYAFTMVLPNGKIIVTGVFTSYGDTPVANLIRLNADGTLDTTFNPGTGVQGFARALAVQPDGKIILAGSIVSVNNIPRNLIARLNADGTVDSSFVPQAGDGVSAYDVLVQPDGKIIVGGNFYDSEYIFGQEDDSVPVYIKRYNTDGSVDSTFLSEESVDNQIWSIDLQDDGKLLAGGWFETVGGVSKNRLARLNNTVLSVKDYQMQAALLYPNPVKDRLTIDTAGFTSATAKITVYNVTGKTVYSAEQAIAGNIQIDMAGYANGLYLLNITAGDKTFTQKVIKN